MIITSTAGIFSPPFASPVATALKNREMVVSGMTTGVIGDAVCTHLGLLLSYILIPYRGVPTMRPTLSLRIRLRTIFPLIAFLYMTANDDYSWSAWLGLLAVPLLLLGPMIPWFTLRRKLLPGRPPQAVLDRWDAIIREYGVRAELFLAPYGSGNGVAVGGRRLGLAVITPEALEWEPEALEVLLRRLAIQLAVNASRYAAAGHLIWLYSGVFVIWIGFYIHRQTDELSVLGIILVLLFGFMFIFSSFGFGHLVQREVDEATAVAFGDGAPMRKLIERVIRESPPELQVSVPAMTAPLWVALPNDDKVEADRSEWGDLTRERFKVLRDAAKRSA